MKSVSMDDIIPGTKNFKWHEALWLPQWKRHATEADGLTDEILENLAVVFSKLQLLRDRLKAKCWVHVAYRPDAYNQLVKGAKKSGHLTGQAIDFHFDGYSCDEIRKILVDENLLEKWNIRCEKMPGGLWVHIDTKPVGPSGRFFPV